jgi:hypothetical protein
MSGDGREDLRNDMLTCLTLNLLSLKVDSCDYLYEINK